MGELLALGAALAWSVSVVLFKRSEAISLVAMMLIAVTLPIIGAGIDWDRPAGDWWRLVLSGVLGIAVADTLFFMALRRLGAGLSAIVDCVYAPAIVGLSVLVLHEHLRGSSLIGGVLVVAGVFLATSERAPRQLPISTATDLPPPEMTGRRQESCSASLECSSWRSGWSS